MTGFLRQLAYGTLIGFRGMQRDLGLVIGFVFLFPLGFLFFLNAIAAPSARGDILVGSVMMELALVNVNILAQSISGDKQTHLYDLWVSLPVNPAVYILSSTLPLLPISLLTAGVTLSAGIFLFHIPIGVSPFLLVPALLLVFGSTTSVGFLVALYGGNPRQINQLAQFLGVIMTFFAPIFYSIDILPPVARYIAYVWPLTWGAILLDSLIASNWSMALEGVGVLSAYTLAGFVLMTIGIRWRQP